jgi:hypothetical protein
MHDADTVLRVQLVIHEVAAQLNNVWHTQVVRCLEQLAHVVLVNVHGSVMCIVQYLAHDLRTDCERKKLGRLRRIQLCAKQRPTTSQISC